MSSNTRSLLKVLTFGTLVSSNAWAQKSEPSSAPAQPAADQAAADAEQLDVDAIKKKYWATGDESSIGVVQNRLYSKAGKFQLGLNGGVSFNDPFVTTRSIGGSVGYFFNETWGVSLLAYKNLNSDSNAYTVLRRAEKDTNRVKTNGYVGVEGLLSLLYGKLSLLGKSIIYYDMNLMAGIGVNKTVSGADLVGGSCVPTAAVPCRTLWTSSKNEPVLHLGLGQRFYLSKYFSLRADYRLMYSGETIREQVVSAQYGSEVGRRDAYTHSFQLGVDVLFGFSGSKKK